MKSEIFYGISTPDAPRAVASYSQGIVIPHGGDIFEVVTSGQVAFDPETNEIVEGGIKPQTMRVLTNIEAILTAGGAQPGDIVETEVVLVDKKDFQAFNKVYGSWKWIKDQDPLPTRFTSVGGIVVPKALVEVKCRAFTRQQG